MKQMSFASLAFANKKKVTRREQFLAEMDRVVPWAQLCALVEPHYPKGERGRPVMPLERMLRIYFMQQWFNLSDPAMEEALYDWCATAVCTRTRCWFMRCWRWQICTSRDDDCWLTERNPCKARAQGFGSRLRGQTGRRRGSLMSASALGPLSPALL